jgi:tRNA nucleotidyltransferase (CCA-adding enzyme)
VSDLAADGAEIIAALNQAPGPWVKLLLQELLQEVALGRVENRRDALVAAAKQLHEKKR